MWGERRGRSQGLRVGLGALCLVSVALVGCSGDDGTSDTSTTELDTDALILDCVSAASALASELWDQRRECATVIRFAHDDLEVLGWQVLCGEATATDEAAARASAAEAAGIGPGAALLGPSPPTDAYVFYEAPAPTGRAAVVSVHSGRALLGASFGGSGGGGALLTPATWRAPEPLRSRCPEWLDLPEARVIDLVGPTEGALGEASGTIDPASADAVLSALARTVAPAAVTVAGIGHDLLLVRYAPELDLGGEVEWIVAIQSGPFH